MKKVLAGLMFLILSLTGCTQVQPTMQPTEPTSQVTQVAQCEEDMPCWDCKTMGNKLCGPQTPAIKAPAESTPEPPKANETVVTQADLQAIETTLDTAPALSIAAQLELESIVFAGSPYIPTDELCTVTYTGTSPYDLTDGDVLWSVQSQVDPTVWHTYHVILTAAPEPIAVQPTTAPQPKQADQPVVVAPMPAPEPNATPTPQPVQPTVEAPQVVQPATPAPQPTTAQEAPQEVTAYNPGACPSAEIKRAAYNEANPDNQAAQGEFAKFC